MQTDLGRLGTPKHPRGWICSHPTPLPFPAITLSETPNATRGAREDYCPLRDSHLLSRGRGLAVLGDQPAIATEASFHCTKDEPVHCNVDDEHHDHHCQERWRVRQLARELKLNAEVGAGGQ